MLFVLEAKFGTHGILGLGGVALLTLGGLLLVDGPIPQMRVSIWTALGVSIPYRRNHGLPDDHCAARPPQ